MPRIKYEPARPDRDLVVWSKAGVWKTRPGERQASITIPLPAQDVPIKIWAIGLRVQTFGTDAQELELLDMIGLSLNDAWSGQQLVSVPATVCQVTPSRVIWDIAPSGVASRALPRPGYNLCAPIDVEASRHLDVRLSFDERAYIRRTVNLCAILFCTAPPLKPREDDSNGE